MFQFEGADRSPRRCAHVVFALLVSSLGCGRAPEDDDPLAIGQAEDPLCFDGCFQIQPQSVKNFATNPHGTFAVLGIDFAQATTIQVEVGAAPLPAGQVTYGANTPTHTAYQAVASQHQVVTINGLTPDTDYWATIHYGDAFGNWHHLTNQPFRTLKRFVQVRIKDIHVVTDGDALSQGELHFFFQVNDAWNYPFSFAQYSMPYFHWGHGMSDDEWSDETWFYNYGQPPANPWDLAPSWRPNISDKVPAWGPSLTYAGDAARLAIFGVDNDAPQNDCPIKYTLYGGIRVSNPTVRQIMCCGDWMMHELFLDLTPKGNAEEFIASWSADWTLPGDDMWNTGYILDCKDPNVPGFEGWADFVNPLAFKVYGEYRVTYSP